MPLACGNWSFICMPGSGALCRHMIALCQLTTVENCHCFVLWLSVGIVEWFCCHSILDGVSFVWVARYHGTALTLARHYQVCP